MSNLKHTHTKKKTKNEHIYTENRWMVIRSWGGDGWVKWVKWVKRYKLPVIK